MLLLHSRLSNAAARGGAGATGPRVEFPQRVDIVSPGETVDHACLVASGLLARFDQMRDGQRQTTALHIAGEMCDLHSVVQPRASWSITALTEASVLFVQHKHLWDAALRHPNLAIAFWRDGMAQQPYSRNGSATSGARARRLAWPTSFAKWV